jgi:carbon storage regulator
MLVLSRRSGESIIINDNVEVKIVEIKGDYVKVGITAPRSIPVHRKEIFEAIQRENARAAQSQTNKEGVAELEKNLDERSSSPELEKEKNTEPKKRPKKPSS